MDLTNVLQDLLKDPKTLETISKKTWLSWNSTKKEIAKVLPSILEQLEENTKDDSKIEWLKNAIEKKHNGSIFDNLEENLDLNDWAKIANHIFWDKLKNVEKLGANKEVLSALWPIVLWALWKTAKAKWWDSLQAIISVLSGTWKKSSILVAFLDKNWDWEIKDDLIRMLINWVKKFFLGKK